MPGENDLNVALLQLLKDIGKVFLADLPGAMPRSASLAPNSRITRSVPSGHRPFEPGDDRQSSFRRRRRHWRSSR